MIHRSHDPNIDNNHSTLKGQIVVRLDANEIAALLWLQKAGGYPSLNCLVRSILKEVVADEVQADEKLATEIGMAMKEKKFVAPGKFVVQSKSRIA